MLGGVADTQNGTASSGEVLSNAKFGPAETCQVQQGQVHNPGQARN